MKNILLKLIPFLPLILVFWIFIKPLSGSGLIAGGDWVSPYTNLQLKTFGNEAWTIWNYRELPTGSQVAHHNLYLFQLLASVFGFIGVSGVAFQKIMVSLFLMGMYLSAYFFLRKGARCDVFPSMTGAIVYLFSPLVFNYFIMGWWFVLFYLAVAPFFVWLCIKYLKNGYVWALVGGGVITAMSFLQSQALIWLFLLAISVGMSLLVEGKKKRILIRLVIFLVSMMAFTFLVHMAWVVPLSFNPANYISDKTSLADMTRFESRAYVFNQLRGWGSLFNEHFELSFSRIFRFSSYIYLLMGLVIGGMILPYRAKLRPLAILALILLFLSPILYLFRSLIALLPYSNVIRDISRFMVITGFGFTMVTALFLNYFRNIYLRIAVVVLIFLSIYPFFLGRLNKPERIKYGNSQFGKDQRVRLLKLPQNEIEKVVNSFHGKRSIFFPTGGYVGAFSDPMFRGPFAETTDYDALFSPYSTGVFVSDKSNSFILNFANSYLDSAVDKPIVFDRLSQMYGIDTVFARRGLYSTFDIKLNSELSLNGCKKIGYKSSDWSISRVCKIKDPFPLFYVSQNPQTMSAQKFYETIVDDKYVDNPRLVSINCFSSESVDSCQIKANFSNNDSVPEVLFKKIGKAKYKVSVRGYDKDYVLVLNETYHSGWIVKDFQSGEKMNFPHVLVNQLVNGWVVNKHPDLDFQEFIVEFYPQMLFSRLIYFSLFFFMVSVFASVFIYVKFPKLKFK